MNQTLTDLLRLGKERGYLTFAEVNELLQEGEPDPERLDQLLQTIEESGIEVIDESEEDERAEA